MIGPQRAGEVGFEPRARRRPRNKVKQRLPAVDEASAGGLVVNGAMAAAVIGRCSRSGHLRWSLPKGHIEPGETAEQAAIREIREETGILGRVTDELGTVEFWFVAGRRRIHKTVRHFLLEAVAGELCDDDHEVSAVEWVPLHRLHSRLAYPDERLLVTRASAILRPGRR